MKQRLVGFSVLSAVLVALALTAPAAAAENQVPFKGTSSGIVTTVGFDPVAGIVYVRSDGQGEATHLGRFTVVGYVAIDVVSGGVQGIVTLTAANGDMLVLALVGGPGIDPAQGIGTFTIVDGTGRFQGATGHFEQVITFAGSPPAEVIPYTEVIEGTISLR